MGGRSRGCGRSASLSAGFVAELGGRRVGFGAMVPFDENPGLQLFANQFRRLDAKGRTRGEYSDWWRWSPGSWELSTLAVEAEFRRQGVGRALAVARLEHARALGARALFVRCIHGSGSAELYQSLGFDRLLDMQGPRAQQALMLLPLGTKAEALGLGWVQLARLRWLAAFYGRPLSTLLVTLLVLVGYGMGLAGGVTWVWLHLLE